MVVIRRTVHCIKSDLLKDIRTDNKSIIPLTIKNPYTNDEMLVKKNTLPVTFHQFQFQPFGKALYITQPFKNLLTFLHQHHNRLEENVFSLPTIF